MQVSGIRGYFVTLSKYKMSKVYFKNKKNVKKSCYNVTKIKNIIISIV